MTLTMLLSSHIASRVALCEALRAHGVTVVTSLGHGPEVRPLKAQVRALLDTEPVVDYLGEHPSILSLVLITFAVGMLGEESFA
jgi:hypothetical protein